MAKVITLGAAGGKSQPGPSLKELRRDTGMTAAEFAAAIGAEAGEPVPTSVYLAYEDGEPPPGTIVRVAQRVAERRRHESPRPRQDSPTDHVGMRPPTVVTFESFPEREFSPAEPAGHQYIASIRDAIQQLVSIEMKLGSNELAPLAVRYLRVARRRLDAGRYDPRLERDLQAELAELAELAAWLLHDAGRQGAARQVSYEALHLARLAGSPQRLDLFILGNLAHVEIFTGRPGAALQIARSALGTDNLSSRMKAMFTIREARALAQLGARAATERALASAHASLLDGVADHDPAWSWWLDEPELTHHTGQAFASLGVHDRALALLEQANEDCPPGRVSGRFIYLAHSLDEAVAAHAWNDAEMIIEQALPYAEEVGSGRAARVLSEAAHRLERVPATPALRDAGQHLRAVLAASTDSPVEEGVDTY